MRAPCVAIALLLVAAPAEAAKRKVIVIEEDDEQEPQRFLSVTLSPLHLLGPYGEAMIEARVGRDFGLAAVGGFGEMPFTSGESRGGFWNLGGQFRYYATGSFDGGMMVGAEMMYLHAPRDVDARAVGAHLSGSPFIGWKLVTRGGFTIDSQLGISVLLVPQKPVDANGERVSTSARPVNLFGGLNVGWTF